MPVTLHKCEQCDDARFNGRVFCEKHTSTKPPMTPQERLDHINQKWGNVLRRLAEEEKREMTSQPPTTEAPTTDSNPHFLLCQKGAGTQEACTREAAPGSTWCRACLHQTVEAMMAALKRAETEGCWCHECTKTDPFQQVMAVCPVCGNKRCPFATDHNGTCSASNEPGQWGSRFIEGQKENNQEQTTTKSRRERSGRSR